MNLIRKPVSSPAPCLFIRLNQSRIQHFMVRIEDNVMKLAHDPVPFLDQAQALIEQEYLALGIPQARVLTAKTQDLLELHLFHLNAVAEGEGD